MSPFISVVIPVYNAEKFIAKAITSVLNQTFQDFELIIVDNGSTDNSLKVINQFRDSRINLFSQPNRGQCKALNLGLEKAKGKFIKFLDADDYVNNVHLEKMICIVKLLEENEADKTLILSRWQRFANDGDLFPIVDRAEWCDSKPIDFITKAIGNGPDMLPGWQWLIPRKIIDSAGCWNENLGLGNDFEFSVRLILASDKIRFSPNSIVYYRSNLKTNMSSDTSLPTILSVLSSSRIAIKNILCTSDDEKLRRACADKLQIWLMSYYPYINSSIVKEVEEDIRALGGSDANADWDKGMLFFKKLIGWKATKMLQYYYYNFKYN